jgi:hypothetical protein
MYALYDMRKGESTKWWVVTNEEEKASKNEDESRGGGSFREPQGNSDSNKQARTASAEALLILKKR